MATNADSETETVQNENVNSGNLKGPQTGKQRAVKRSFHEGAMGVDQELGDDEDDVNSFVLFDIEEKLKSSKYDKNFVREMLGPDLTVSYMQKEGFNNPIIVKSKEGLGLNVPNVTVKDVRGLVGSRRNLDVLDVVTQKDFQMTMKEFEKYWEQPPESRKKLLNVISLEFSNTKLDLNVLAPKIVRQIDWIDKVWPRFLKELQQDGSNALETMMFPKVQKYVLMSVKGCWTDFHIDLGGTSVWYHIIKGAKVFWLIPPTEENFKRYEAWVLSGKQSEQFFGDLVENCSRIYLEAGNTFFIPSGWIHAVYTPEDSLVFGGNFLHSFGILHQLKVAQLEEITHVPQRLRFPFFTEMCWFVLDRYVQCLLGTTHLKLPDEEKKRLKIDNENIDFKDKRDHVHLTKLEVDGLIFLVSYLHCLPASKKNIPEILIDPVKLVQDIRKVVITHRDDCPDVAVTGKYILRWNENEELDSSQAKKRGRPPKLSLDPLNPGEQSPNGKKKGKKRTSSADGLEGIAKISKQANTPGNARRRRVRCKKCTACMSKDCKNCGYCKDMVKYGGPGRMKQTCEKRRCTHPQLPICAYCSVCKLDGWYNEPKLQVKETERPAEPPKLFECSVCLEIIHPDCAEKTIGMGKVNPEINNCWECAKCMNQAFTGGARNGSIGQVMNTDDLEEKHTLLEPLN